MSKAKKSVKQKHPKKFPQIFRSISASYLLLLGALLWLSINVLYMLLLPENLKRLLKEPKDTKALSAVLFRVKDRQLKTELKKLLKEAGQEGVVKNVEQQQTTVWQKIKEGEALLQKYPKYPDGYAYLSLLYEKIADCDRARQLINRAVELDKNRREFVKIKAYLDKCN